MMNELDRWDAISKALKPAFRDRNVTNGQPDGRRFLCAHNVLHGLIHRAVNNTISHRRPSARCAAQQVANVHDETGGRLVECLRLGRRVRQRNRPSDALDGRHVGQPHGVITTTPWWPDWTTGIGELEQQVTVASLWRAPAHEVAAVPGSTQGPGRWRSYGATQAGGHRPGRGVGRQSSARGCRR
jgi:hypothetical protein